MPKIICGEILHNDCPVVFESGDENYVLEQFQMHAKGSHGESVGSSTIRSHWQPVVEAVETVTMSKVPVNEIPITEVQPDEKTKEKGKRLSFLRKLKK